MTTTGAAEKVAAKPAEKVEKRRALGRGLESLLPGPRVVAGTAPLGAGRVEDPVGGSGAVSEQQVPFDSPSPIGSGSLRAGSHFVRNDKTIWDGTAMVDEETIEIQAVAEEELGAGRAGEPVGDSGGADSRRVPHFVRDDKLMGSAEAVGLAGQPGAAVPTLNVPTFGAEGITLQAVAEEAAARGTFVRAVPIKSIEENPFQTRYLFDKEALKELADSIKVNGVLQPIILRPGEEEGRYILVLGERRLRASKLAGKETIPAIIRRVSAQQAAEMTLIENLQREDLNCIEQAEAFRVLSKEFNMTQEEIGKRVGMSRESVSNYMRLLRLPEAVMEYLATDRLSFSEARELLGLHDENKMLEAAEIVVGKHMSLEEIETLVAKYNGWPDAQDPAKKPGGARWQDPNVRAAQTELEQLLRVRVRIKDRKGKGRIVIEYATVDDYERVVGMLKGK
jgi:ParB family transcriptional regulator, chromosome partitioning protein